jgi:hypothetical protein
MVNVYCYRTSIVSIHLGINQCYGECELLLGLVVVDTHYSNCA